jgi:hypothetical protein
MQAASAQDAEDDDGGVQLLWAGGYSLATRVVPRNNGLLARSKHGPPQPHPESLRPASQFTISHRTPSTKKHIYSFIRAVPSLLSQCSRSRQHRSLPSTT